MKSFLKHYKKKILLKYSVNHTIDTEIIADYFQVRLNDAIERGHTIGYF